MKRLNTSFQCRVGGTRWFKKGCQNRLLTYWTSTPAGIELDLKPGAEMKSVNHHAPPTSRAIALVKRGNDFIGIVRILKLKRWDKRNNLALSTQIEMTWLRTTRWTVKRCHILRHADPMEATSGTGIPDVFEWKPFGNAVIANRTLEGRFKLTGLKYHLMLGTPNFTVGSMN